MQIRKKIAVVAVAALSLLAGGVAGAATASAAGSDGPTPYSVTTEGITLPAGATFADNGHVNIKTNQGPRNIHFESLNNQPSGQWIGQSFLPWSAFGLDAATVCVSWVQMAEYNEHFGEGGQAPVGAGCTPSTPVDPDPEPSTDPPVEQPFTPDLAKVTASSANTCILDESGTKTGSLTVKGYLRNPTPYTLTGTLTVEGQPGIAAVPFTVAPKGNFTSYTDVPATDGRLVYSITTVDGKAFEHTVTRPYFDTALCAAPKPEPEPVGADVVFKPVTCTEDGAIDVAEVDGVNYLANGGHIGDMTIPAAAVPEDGLYVRIEAKTPEGVELGSWEYEFTLPTDCGTVTPPEEPTEPEEPTTPTEPNQPNQPEEPWTPTVPGPDGDCTTCTPTVPLPGEDISQGDDVAAPVAAQVPSNVVLHRASAPTTAALAVTGSNAGVGALAAAGLLTLGGGAVLLSRKRRVRH